MGYFTPQMFFFCFSPKMGLASPPRLINRILTPNGDVPATVSGVKYTYGPKIRNTLISYLWRQSFFGLSIVDCLHSHMNDTIYSFPEIKYLVLTKKLCEKQHWLINKGRCTYGPKIQNTLISYLQRQSFLVCHQSRGISWRDNLFWFVISREESHGVLVILYIFKLCAADILIKQQTACTIT